MQIDNGKPARAEKRKTGRKQPARRVGADQDGEADRLAVNLEALGPEAVDFARRLLVANEFRMWAECPNESCRRTRTCRGADVDCFDTRRPELTRRVLAHVVMLLCTANIGSDAFYDYLDRVTADADADGQEACSPYSKPTVSVASGAAAASSVNSG